MKRKIESENLIGDSNVDHKTTSARAVHQSIKRRERRNRISLQTVTVPTPLQEALDKVLSGACVSEIVCTWALFLGNVFVAG